MKKIQKLSLNKSIVSNLTSEEANQIVGGDTSYIGACQSLTCNEASICFCTGGAYSCNDCPDSDGCYTVVRAYCPV
jgi:hypothetical protein